MLNGLNSCSLIGVKLLFNYLVYTVYIHYSLKKYNIIKSLRKGFKILFFMYLPIYHLW